MFNRMSLFLVICVALVCYAEYVLSQLLDRPTPGVKLDPPTPVGEIERRAQAWIHLEGAWEYTYKSEEYEYCVSVWFSNPGTSREYDGLVYGEKYYLALEEHFFSMRWYCPYEDLNEAKHDNHIWSIAEEPNDEGSWYIDTKYLWQNDFILKQDGSLLWVDGDRIGAVRRASDEISNMWGERILPYWKEEARRLR